MVLFLQRHHQIDQLKSELERAARAGANVSQTFLLRFSTLKGRFVRLRNEKVSLEEEIQGKEAKTKEEVSSLQGYLLLTWNFISHL